MSTVSRAADGFGRQSALVSAVRALVSTEGGYAAAIARVVLGLVVLPHGAQKVLGWFGGYGFSGTMGWFVQMGVPAPVAFLVILAESLGAVALLLGVFGRVAAVGVLGVMAGAVALVHYPNGFFMNWFGNQAGEGYEYHVLAAGLALIVSLAGSGAASVDRWLAKRLA